MKQSNWSRWLTYVLFFISPLAEAQYLKVSNVGLLLPDNASLGSKPDDWACTYDNTKKLIWEVKTADQGLRDQHWTYSWFNSQAPANQRGLASGSSNCKTLGRCDTEKFVQDVNTQRLCGAKNWRLSTIQELKSLIRCSGTPLTDVEMSCQGTFSSPTIDTQYFPNTPNPQAWTWSATAYEDDPTLGAWYVDFDGSGLSIAGRENNGSVRLVHSGLPIADVASYDDKTNLLVIKAVQVGNQVFSATLQNIGNYQFKLLQAPKISYNQDLQLPVYQGNTSTGQLIIPVTFALGNYFYIEMQYKDGLFSITTANPL